ncbi:ogr/Delta-like zinc finger family protein [Pseudomonas sp. F01002]|uniref:ogr/Delta-like zinc finger family protein n=1 Tax=Pseudomonas sp. F01002 TaxID=2555724 RepID=UPI00273EE1B9|nr:ogr/Delta-like zinc finger family protein [Pseudomonas sp. F01002]
MAISGENKLQPRHAKICKRATHNRGKFQSWTGSMMLGPSRFGGKIPMSANPKTRRQRPCPDCGAALIRRSSNSEHLLLSKTLLVCKSAVCGATFTGIDEITHRLSPPSQPNTDIQLPYAPSAVRRGVLLALGLSTENEQPISLIPNFGELESRP